MMTTTDYVREHLATVDTTELAASQVPADFRDVDHTQLNGIEGPGIFTDPTDWDFGRFADEH